MCQWGREEGVRHAHMYASVCSSMWRPEVCIGFHCSGTIYLCLSLVETFKQVGLAGQIALGLFSLHLPSVQIICTDHNAQLFYTVVKHKSSCLLIKYAADRAISPCLRYILKCKHRNAYIRKHIADYNLDHPSWFVADTCIESHSEAKWQFHAMLLVWTLS